MLEYLTHDQLLVFSKYEHKAPKTTLELYYINHLLKGLEASLPAVKYQISIICIEMVPKFHNYYGIEWSYHSYIHILVS